MAQAQGTMGIEQMVSNRESDPGSPDFEVHPMGMKFIRWLLEGVMVISFFAFVIFSITLSTEFSQDFWWKWTSATDSPGYGLGGLLYGSPIFLIVFLGSIYLYFFPRTSKRQIKKKGSRASLATQPWIVRGPFGVLSGSEVLGIAFFTVVAGLTLGMFVVRGYQGASQRSTEDYPMWAYQLNYLAFEFGVFGQIGLGLLFLPVARSSVLLRIADIPFERAAKYHVWIGHLTMIAYTLHGVIYMIIWKIQGEFNEDMRYWESTGTSIPPGAVAMFAGIVMWITTFSRRRYFELFFYTHQLYIIFIIFMGLHVGEWAFGYAFPGIFLFLFDRFLRFCQSRKNVSILAAKVLPSGTIELTLPRTSYLQYNALSFIFLNIPRLSHLEWHPFSVSSSPNDPTGNIKFLIKPLGSWTRKLSDAIVKASETKCPFRMTATVEGPYGHESSYFLDYEVLLLVGGGIGVAPFIAVIEDLLYHYQQGETQLPTDVTLIWAVRNQKELRILDSLKPSTIFPEYASKLNLTVKIYVTKENDIDLEPGEEEPQSAKHDPDTAQKYVSHLAGSGSILWVCGAIALSLGGYFLVMGLIGRYSFRPITQELAVVVDYDTLVLPWWWYLRGCVFFFGLFVGVCFFGGSVLLAWYWVGSRSAKKQPPTKVAPLVHEYEKSEISEERLVQSHNTVYGSRPDLQEIFEGLAKRCGSHVGVLVCGPEGLETSVATQCRAINATYNKHHEVAFSYHSVSFNL